MANADAVTATRRFGLGAKAGEIAVAAGDPRGAVAAQLADPQRALLAEAPLASSAEILARQITLQRAVREARARAPAPASTPTPSSRPEMPATDPPAPSAEPATPGAVRREAYRLDAVARYRRAIETSTPLIERLVWFWSNHFTVSGAKTEVRGIVGAFEREAIRPHVLGRFDAMLRAVVQHPAMLIYLDNHRSIGPGTALAQRRGRGLNENLAREVLELHSLGVDGGYTQADVIALARLITGWTVGGMAGVDAEPGRFVFVARRNDPGPVQLLGQRYAAGGIESGERALADLARHPATARHIAVKLARHFVADAPPEPLVARMTAQFLESDGDLQAVTRLLVTADEAWSAPPRKILPPFDFLVAMTRGLALQPRSQELIRLARLVGQPLWQAPSPKGWPDSDDAWTSPSGLRERLRIAERATQNIGPEVDPRALAESLLGPISNATRTAIAQAETRAQGLQLLVMSPEFQRR